MTKSPTLQSHRSTSVRKTMLSHMECVYISSLPLSNVMNSGIFYYVLTGIQCENPVGLTMLNGNITTSDPNYFYGATLLFECNEGYELKGDDTISCLENGWTPRGRPYCTSKCL